MIYLDNASTTYPKPEAVYRTMDTFYRENGVNAGRGQYQAAAAVEQMISRVRQQGKALLHCGDDYETVLTASATEALNTVLQGIDFAHVQHVYTTGLEHNAVKRTLKSLQLLSKFDIIHLAVGRNMQLDLIAISKQVEAAPPDLLVMTHASNVTGQIVPIGEIAEAARRYRPLVILDMAQTAGLVDIDIAAIGIDAAVFAGHKTLYGPFGAAGLVMKKSLQLRPLLHGGVGIDSASENMPDEAPVRYEAGSRNVQAIAGLQAALT